MMKHHILMFLLVVLISSNSWAQQLVLGEENVVNLSGRGNAYALFDEPFSIAPKTVFQPDYNEIFLPAEVIIDLLAIHDLEQIKIFDANNKGVLEIFSGDPSAWDLVKKLPLDRYNQWVEIALNRSTRFILLRFTDAHSLVSEIQFFAKATEPFSCPTPVNNFAPKTLNQIMGVNAFHDDPLPKIKNVAGFIREYHNWDWDEGNGMEGYAGYPNHQLAWAPSWVDHWDFDVYYKSVKEHQIEVAPCLQGSAAYVRGRLSRDAKPTRSIKIEPKNFKAHASYFYQFAARYGSTSSEKATLKLRGDQAQISGLGYVDYLENWNEPDKWWRGREGYFTPFEFAAMCSADYDGHEGALGKNIGLKNADSSLKMVMGGLAEINLHYLNGMRLWSDYNRKNGLPADVLNVHHYSNNGGGQSGKATHAISPEEDHLKEKLQALVNWRNTYYPEKEVWLSEFGYDCNPKSAQGMPAIKGFTAEQVQGMWLVRSFLEIMASGIDRAAVFMFRDVNASNPNKYNSSGLTAEKYNQHEPKTSYFMLAQFKYILGEYAFEKELDVKKEDVKFYQFRSGENKAFVLWCSTSTGATQSFKLKLDSDKNYMVYRLSAQGLQSAGVPLELSKGSATLHLSEIPVFIKESP